jgi:hypothetical protein
VPVRFVPTSLLISINSSYYLPAGKHIIYQRFL